MEKDPRPDEAMAEALRLVVREQRDKSGLSLRQLADASGVDRSVIQRIETGGRRIYWDVPPKLAAAFGMGPVEFTAIIYSRAQQILEVLQTEDKPADT